MPSHLAEFTLTTPFRLTLRHMPAGEFLMGSAETDPQAEAEEKPQHRVNVAALWMATAPVTVAQWTVFVETTHHQTTAEKVGRSYGYLNGAWQNIDGANWRHPLGPQSDVQHKSDHPVTHLSWHDAQAFCLWLSEMAQMPFRLPTEAEWEKAARGPALTDANLWPWGNTEPDSTRCNFNLHLKDTTPVGAYSPQGDSAYGLHDLAGNVWEWTNSLWGRDWRTPHYRYPYHPADGREPIEADDTLRRVARGGSFNPPGGFVRCAARYAFAPHEHLSDLGMRVCAQRLR